MRRFDDERNLAPSRGASGGSARILPRSARWVSRLLMALVLLCLTLAGLFWWLLLRGAM